MKTQQLVALLSAAAATTLGAALPKAQEDTIAPVDGFSVTQFYAEHGIDDSKFASNQITVSGSFVGATNGGFPNTTCTFQSFSTDPGSLGAFQNQPCDNGALHWGLTPKAGDGEIYTLSLTYGEYAGSITFDRSDYHYEQTKADNTQYAYLDPEVPFTVFGSPQA